MYDAREYVAKTRGFDIEGTLLIPQHQSYGIPTTVEEMAAFEEALGARVHAALYLSITEEALAARMPLRDSDAWDSFEPVERELDDEALLARHASFEGAVVPLLRLLSSDGRLRSLSVVPPSELVLSQAESVLEGVTAGESLPAPSVMLVLGGAGTGRAALCGTIPASAGCAAGSAAAAPAPEYGREARRPNCA